MTRGAATQDRLARWRAAGLAALVALGLCTAAGFAAWHRLAREAEQAGFTGDEGISLLAATCHQVEFLHVLRGEGEPYGHWTTSRAWKRFIQPEAFACFHQISRDLAAVDFHPPLYFWMLHVWLSLVGVQRWSFVLLNVLFALGTIAGLYVLGVRLLASRLSGVALAAIWAMSPLPAAAGVEGRPYELLALTTVWFVAQLVTCCDQTVEPGRRQLVWLGVATAVGTLTHYLFLIILVGAAVFASTRFIRRSRARLLRVAGAVLTGLLLAALIHPVVQQVHAKSGNAIAVDSERAVGLRRKVVARELDFFTRASADFTDAGSAAAAGLGVVVLGSIIAATRRQLDRTAWRPRLQGADMLSLVATVVLVTTYLYATRRLPQHAMSAKYLSFLWPLMPLVPVVMARLVPPLDTTLELAMVGIFVVAGWRSIPDAAQLSNLVQPLASEETGPLVYLTHTWHPTAAALVRQNDEAPLFVASPADGSGALYERWLKPVNDGAAVDVAVVTPYAKQILRRLETDGYELRQPPHRKNAPIKWFAVTGHRK